MSATYDDLFEAAEAAQAAADATGENHHVRKERSSGQLVVQPTTPVDGDRFFTVWGPAEPSEVDGTRFMVDDRDGLENDPPADEQGDMSAHLAHARYLGADAALSSVIDHCMMSEPDARSVLDDVDPEVLDRYPGPNLSGEWADGLLYAVRYEMGTEADAIADAIADAWAEGRDAVWGNALQATALRVLGEIERALDVERDLEADVASYRKAAGL